MRLLSILLPIKLSLVIVMLFGLGVASVELEQIPTSHPTMFFVAPSVPDEDGEQANTIVTKSPTQSPTLALSQTSSSSRPSGVSDGTGPSYKDEITEENQTAVNTSSYMFYTFIGLIAVIAGGYYFRRWCGGGGSAQEAPRYQPVHTRDHDDDDFFSNRDIEMTRGGFSNTRHF